jgi:peptidoglycan/LPS O-acetylase OafA/YrhL
VPARFKVTLLLEYANLFIAGMMFYLMTKQGSSIRQYVILAVCLMAQWFVSHGELMLIVAGFFIVFQLAIRGRLAFMTWKPLVYLGTISYALYLVHQNIGYVLIRALERRLFHPNISIVIAMAISIGLASMVTFLVEKPMLQAIRTWHARIRETTMAHRAARYETKGVLETS